MRVRNDHDYDRDWYIKSGYHRWTNTLDYPEVIASQPEHRKRLLYALERIGYGDLVRGKSVLEIAFNNCKTVFWALERYGQICRYSMFDFDPHVVRWAREVNPGWEIDIFEADLTAVPREPGTFDFIFCLDVIEHLTKEVYQEMIRELYRLLTPGGEVLVLIGKGNASGHIHLIPDKQAIKDFQEQGFFLVDRFDYGADTFWRARK